MQQKAQFIATVLHEPEILILDEPLSGLDPVGVDLMRDVLLDLRRQGRTLVLSSHQMETVERLCDAIALINRGRKVLDGARGRREEPPRQEHAWSSPTRATVRSWPRCPGVEHVSDFGRYVEVRMTEGADPQAILREAAARLRLSRFEVVEPSLHDIFVRAGHGARRVGAGVSRGVSRRCASPDGSTWSACARRPSWSAPSWARCSWAGSCSVPALLSPKQRGKPLRSPCSTTGGRCGRPVERALAAAVVGGQPRFDVQPDAGRDRRQARALAARRCWRAISTATWYLPHGRARRARRPSTTAENVSNMMDLRLLEQAVEEAFVEQRLAGRGARRRPDRRGSRATWTCKTHPLTASGAREDRGAGVRLLVQSC